MNEAKEFAALNIKCDGCANTIRKKLLDDYGPVHINLEVEPRVLTLQVQEDFDEAAFRAKMIKMGYPLADEDLSTIESVGAKAKSYVSCAIGKMDANAE
jgi:copper chaperone CopZ